ncbi:cutinase family protein [Mycolicibacterium smegmatis]|uniref:cutinase family protein n=1 Tax=Mycolicibacterium smegmatis TaxID=1772 RepID=UPI001EFB6805|nr:cutinase family protein [Mycolicibacterium smegmatis]ULN36362.1 cutinase family protein [Mycolicibacterium smegmatis]
MGRLRLAGLVAVAAAATSGMQIAAMPSAMAAPCPDAEVIFARGTTELPGLGPTGDAFVEALRPQLGDKTLGVYAVDYPATTAFSTAVQGIADARARILANAANCPDTKMVLGGFSQGAAVMGFVTSSAVPDGVSPAEVPAPMPPEIADHVAAVALFGKPSPRFMRVLNDPPVVVGPYYAAKAIDLCVDNDLVCDPKGSSFAVHNQYQEFGLVTQAATFVAQKLQADWAAEEAADEETPDEATPAPRTPPTRTPSPLSAPVGATPPAQQIASTPAPVGTGPLPGPAVAPPPTAPLA